MNMETLRSVLDMSFTLTLIAFAAGAFFLFMEKDRVLPEFRTIMRVSTVYLTIAAVNYLYMKQVYAAGAASGVSKFPTEYRYVDWILTTPLMLMKFPLLLGMGKRGRAFMTRLVCLDLLMIVTGYIGELSTTPLIHHGFFLIGCVAWFVILASLFNALTTLPDRLGPAVRLGVKNMSLFVVIGWAIYPVGFFTPMLGIPAEVRELVYNAADLFNKVGLSLLVYTMAVQTAKERAAAATLVGEDVEAPLSEPEIGMSDAPAPAE